MIIKPTDEGFAQLREWHVSPLILGRIYRRGTRRTHPSGAQMYTWEGMTMVADLRDGELHVFRFYK